MSRFKPVGARLLVEDIVTSLSIVERGRRAGIEVVVESDNKPKATMGKVVALGNDPLLKEFGVQLGDVVFFSWHAGHNVYLEDREFRMLELQEITAIESMETAELPPELGAGSEQKVSEQSGRKVS